MFARTTWGRALAVWLSVGLSQAAVPAVAPAAPAPDVANGHLVDRGEVARRLLARAKTRDERVKLFQEALATPEARQKARTLGADADRLRAAVPHLTDRELADLSARAARVKDVAAGHGGSEGALIMLGILLVVAGIAVLVAVADDHYYDEYYWDDCWCY
ncbi:MAG TPA: hypothetical protein VLL75_14915 [Vicinamibacteria bacterium]|nr:hypothetical protein [Vicinamibacteria bacterium]